MLFNSMAFAIFLPIAFFSYWAIPPRWRWIQLLTVSYYFYMSWNAKYVLLILFTTALSYFCALRIEGAQDTRVKKRWMWTLLVASLGVLFVFKYFNFFLSSVFEVLNAVAIPVSPVMLQLALPVGISFYTFQTIGYVVDVYRGTIPAERHFGQYAAFISFFPQLVAGPIERACDLLPQIKQEHTFDYAQASYGLRRMAWGFFKKLLLADGVSRYVNVVYNDIDGHQGFAIVVATFLFAVQIYCDFSGYSDIAQGTAKLFGIELMTNFKSPYFSTSVKEFWSRWHISLSGWLRDYVYIPLGGNRCGKLRHAFNLLVTFLVSGLWHGAQWTFVVWGVLHGAAQIFEMEVPALHTPVKNGHWFVRTMRTLLTFCFCTATWAVFRADSLASVGKLFRGMFVGVGSLHSYIGDAYYSMGFHTASLSFSMLVVLLLILAAFDFVSARGYDPLREVEKLPSALRCVVYASFLLLMVWALPTGQQHEFIYFQF